MARNSERTAPEGRDSGDLFPPRLPADHQEYFSFYRMSVEKRTEFWSVQARRLLWDKKFTTAEEADFAEGRISWFPDGALNACRNVLEARKKPTGGRPVLLFLDRAGAPHRYTRDEVAREVRRFAAALAGQGLKQGARAAFYLPDSPETVFLALACAFLGVIPVPIPTRYAAELVGEILADSGASFLAVAFGSDPQHYESRARAVVRAAGITVVNMGTEQAEGAISLDAFLAAGAPLSGTGAGVPAEHPLFILYANSAAGVPRGSVFPTGGFLVQAAASYDYLLGAEPGGMEDGLVCTLDLASASGQCYGFWGPLLNGVPLVLIAEERRESAERLRQALELTGSPVLLTSPVILSALRRETGGAALSERRFRLLAASGDDLKPRHIQFAAQALVSSPERTLNLWVQTECGAALIGTWPDPGLNRPGALGLPFPGIEPVVLNSMTRDCRPNESGQLVFRSSWPAMIRTIWGQDERYRQLYFGRVPGYYGTNDGVRVDDQGFVWFMGRLDDVIKLRGQSLATAEVETVLAAHPRVAEAAVVGVEGEEGEAEIVAFLVLDVPIESGEEMLTLEAELSRSIEGRLGEFALLSRYIIAPELPRTRTGKIVRRVLKRIVSGTISMDEDLSHLANPGSVEKLIRERGL